MAERGVHFALTPEQDARVLAAAQADAVAGDAEGHAIMREVATLEASWDTAWLCETDAAWDAIHRCFCMGKLLYEGGEAPLNLLICGGRQLSANDDYTVSHVSAEPVAQVASAALAVTHDGMRQRYGQIKQRGYSGRLGDADFEQAWVNFQDVTRLFSRVADEARAVIFTVDC